MANKKLTELPAISTVSSTTIFLVDDTGTTQTANGTVVKNYITSTDMVLTGNLTPAAGNTYTLGSPTNKWADIYVGPNSIHLQDTANSQLDATMTITNGVLLINGANQLQVGQLKFVDNTIESITDSTDIQIGLTSSSANLVLNRNTVLGSDKTLTTSNYILVQDGSENDVIKLNTDGNIVFNGSDTLKVGGGFFVSSVSSTDGQGNIVTYDGGEFKYGPQLKDYAGNIGANNITLTGILKAPQTTKASNATGTVGQICWDANYIYICTAVNTWKRSPLTGGY
jgi:hypothetical protein